MPRCVGLPDGAMKAARDDRMADRFGTVTSLPGGHLTCETILGCPLPQPRMDPAVPTDVAADALDQIMGRAVLDPEFCGTLLRNPLEALALEAMPLSLKHALVAIRARSLGEFAVRALEAEAALIGPKGPAHHGAHDRVRRLVRPRRAGPVVQARP